NDKDVCLIDSPCLDILPAIELFNYFTLKYPNNYLYLDPIGILNKYVSVDVDDELKKGGKSVLLLYFSSNRKKGLYHPKIYEFVSKYKHNNK
ncbi:MAG: hypothetical protein N3B13_04800, partial [Deltaproteobacteria bacterium]|nr:hypothetical protein [Deltaproteobacteria bacterium]